jgi:hypothetical protein
MEWANIVGLLNVALIAAVLVLVAFLVVLAVKRNGLRDDLVDQSTASGEPILPMRAGRIFCAPVSGLSSGARCPGH